MEPWDDALGEDAAAAAAPAPAASRKRKRAAPSSAFSAAAADAHLLPQARRALRSAHRPLDRHNPDLTLVAGVEWCIVHVCGAVGPCWRRMAEAFPDVQAALLRSTTTYRTRRVFMADEPPPDAAARVVVQHTKGVLAVRTAPPARLRACVGGHTTELLDAAGSAPSGEGFLAMRSYQDVPGSKGGREVTIAAARVFPTALAAAQALDAWEAVPSRASRGSWRAPDFLERTSRALAAGVASALQAGEPGEPPRPAVSPSAPCLQRRRAGGGGGRRRKQGSGGGGGSGGGEAVEYLEEGGGGGGGGGGGEDLGESLLESLLGVGRGEEEEGGLAAFGDSPLVRARRAAAGAAAEARAAAAALAQAQAAAEAAAEAGF